MNSQTFEQSIWINAPLPFVDEVITDRAYMHQWLNPLLRCEPLGEWSDQVGSESLFVIQIPGLRPTLKSQVIERSLGLVVWGFDGFFQGQDRWSCSEQDGGTLLLNQFTFIPASPLVEIGFRWFAASLTKRDMEQQLQRLKQVAESLNPSAP